MFGHIFHAVRIQSAHVIILSVDTDVFILAIYYWKELANIGCLGLWFDGSYKKKHLLGCHLAAESLGESICNILPALHSVSGCDTTSRLGSKKQFLKAESEDFVQTALVSLGNLDLNAEQLKQLETVWTYVFSTTTKLTADELRYKLISQNIGFGFNLMTVICTSDALHLHLLRATVQTFIWKNAHQTQLEPIDYSLFGYEENNGDLRPRQMTKPRLPESLIQPCKCTSNCRTISCSCKKSESPCISLCKCINNDCLNKND